MADPIISDSSPDDYDFVPPIITPNIWDCLLKFFYASVRTARQVEEYALKNEPTPPLVTILELIKQVREEAELLKHWISYHSHPYRSKR